MDKIAERLSAWFGSAPFILLHILWFGLWYPLGGKTDILTVIVSLEAIFLSLFILRAEIVQSSRTEKNVKADLAKSDEVIKLLKGKRDARR